MSDAFDCPICGMTYDLEEVPTFEGFYVCPCGGFKSPTE